jgi:RNA-binding protein YhbY
MSTRLDFCRIGQKSAEFKGVLQQSKKALLPILGEGDLGVLENALSEWNRLIASKEVRTVSRIQSLSDRSANLIQKKAERIKQAIGSKNLGVLQSTIFMWKENAQKVQAHIHMANPSPFIDMDPIGADWRDMLGETELMY